MGWQSNCSRCGADMPPRRPLTVEAISLRNGYHQKRRLLVYCETCAPIIERTLLDTVPKQR